MILNHPDFIQEISVIYPPQLELKRTTEAIDKLSYLDITIQNLIVNGKFTTSVYDKRDKFKSISLTLISNIPCKPVYGI